jgi:hypothetical protein
LAKIAPTGGASPDIRRAPLEILGDADRQIDAPGAAPCRPNNPRIEIQTVSRSAEAAAAAHRVPERSRRGAARRLAEMPCLRDSAVETPEQREYTSGTDSGRIVTGTAGWIGQEYRAAGVRDPEVINRFRAPS